MFVSFDVKNIIESNDLDQGLPNEINKKLNLAQIDIKPFSNYTLKQFIQEQVLVCMDGCVNIDHTDRIAFLKFLIHFDQPLQRYIFLYKLTDKTYRHGQDMNAKLHLLSYLIDRQPLFSQKMCDLCQLPNLPQSSFDDYCQRASLNQRVWSIYQTCIKADAQKIELLTTGLERIYVRTNLNQTKVSIEQILKKITSIRKSYDKQWETLKAPFSPFANLSSAAPSGQEKPIFEHLLNTLNFYQGSFSNQWKSFEASYQSLNKDLVSDINDLQKHVLTCSCGHAKEKLEILEEVVPNLTLSFNHIEMIEAPLISQFIQDLKEASTALPNLSKENEKQEIEAILKTMGESAQEKHAPKKKPKPARQASCFPTAASTPSPSPKKQSVEKTNKEKTLELSCKELAQVIKKQDKLDSNQTILFSQTAHLLRKALRKAQARQSVPDSLNQDLKQACDTFSKELRYHIFMGTCGFELAVSSLAKQDLAALKAIFPTLNLDWALQLEQLLAREWTIKSNRAKDTHSLNALYATIGNDISFSEKVKTHIGNNDLAVILARYPVYQQAKANPQTLSSLLINLKAIRNLEPSAALDERSLEHLRAVISFIFASQAKSQDAIIEYLQGRIGQKEFKALKQTIQAAQEYQSRLKNHLLKQYASSFKAASKPQTDDRFLEMEKQIDSLLASCDTLIGKTHQNSNIYLHLKEAQSYLEMIKHSIPLISNYSSHRFSAWQFRNMLNFKYVFEQLYHAQVKSRGIQISTKHNLASFQKSLNHLLDNELEKGIRAFNLNRGLHYTYTNTSSEVDFTDDLRSISQESKKYASISESELSKIHLERESSRVKMANVLKKGVALAQGLLEQTDTVLSESSLDLQQAS